MRSLTSGICDTEKMWPNFVFLVYCLFWSHQSCWRDILLCHRSLNEGCQTNKLWEIKQRSTQAVRETFEGYQITWETNGDRGRPSWGLSSFVSAVPPGYSSGRRLVRNRICLHHLLVHILNFEPRANIRASCANFGSWGETIFGVSCSRINKWCLLLDRDYS